MNLPYEFDTTAIWRKLFGFALGLVVVLAAGVLYSVLVTHAWVVVAQLLIVIAIIAWFGAKIGRNIEGSVGTITHDHVTVARGRAVLGARFPGPEGRFPVSAFTRVRVEQSSGPITPGVQGGPNARIYLAGDGVPDILIARESGNGLALALEIADALGLAVQDTRAPF